MRFFARYILGFSLLAALLTACGGVGGSGGPSGSSTLEISYDMPDQTSTSVSVIAAVTGSVIERPISGTGVLRFDLQPGKYQLSTSGYEAAGDTPGIIDIFQGVFSRHTVDLGAGESETSLLTFRRAASRADNHVLLSAELESRIVQETESELVFQADADLEAIETGDVLVREGSAANTLSASGFEPQLNIQLDELRCDNQAGVAKSYEVVESVDREGDLISVKTKPATMADVFREGVDVSSHCTASQISLDVSEIADKFGIDESLIPEARLEDVEVTVHIKGRVETGFLDLIDVRDDWKPLYIPSGLCIGPGFINACSHYFVVEQIEYHFSGHRVGLFWTFETTPSIELKKSLGYSVLIAPLPLVVSVGIDLEAAASVANLNMDVSGPLTMDVQYENLLGDGQLGVFSVTSDSSSLARAISYKPEIRFAPLTSDSSGLKVEGSVGGYVFLGFGLPARITEFYGRFGPTLALTSDLDDPRQFEDAYPLSVDLSLDAQFGVRARFGGSFEAIGPTLQGTVWKRGPFSWAKLGFILNGVGSDETVIEYREDGSDAWRRHDPNVGPYVLIHPLNPYEVQVAAAGSGSGGFQLLPSAACNSATIDPNRISVENVGDETVCMVEVSASVPSVPSIVSFSASPNQVEAGESVTFSLSASHPDGEQLLCSIQTGDGGTLDMGDCGSGSISSSYVYDLPGNYHASVSVTDASGDSDTETVSVDVLEATEPTENVVWRVDPDQLTFVGEEGGPAPASKTFVLHNEGTTSGSFRLDSAASVTTSPSSGSVPDGQDVTITVAVEACEDAKNSFFTIDVSGGGSTAAVGVQRQCSAEIDPTGSIRAEVSGLPSGALADILISNGEQFYIASETTLIQDVPPGGYDFTAQEVQHDGTTYRATPASGQIMVVEGETALLSITYEGSASRLGDVDWISAGHNHSLAVREGAVLAWGINNDGELGIGTTSASTSPSDVLTSGLVTAVDGGSDHSLAILADGSVLAWGSNEDAELANSSICSADDCFSSQPVEASSFSSVVDVSSGAGQSAALRSYGNVFMWGRNYGAEPVMVEGISSVVDVELGQNHALALKDNGTVWAWGSNGSGELGDGTFLEKSEPQQVAGLDAVVDIAAGNGFSVAVLADGTVWTWGDNGDGELGIGETGGKFTSPQRVPGLTDIVAAAAGYAHVVALRSNGVVVAWGANFSGQLGDGSTTPRNLAGAVDGIGSATQVAAGLSHSLALLSDGTVLSWGENSSGQLGDGSNIDRHTPTPVVE